ncbi:YcxB family protein [Frisingicoccus sp.]
MVNAKIEIGQEEMTTLIEIMLNSPVNVKKRKIGRIFSTICLVVMIFYTVFVFSIHDYALIFVGVAFVILFAWFSLNGGVTLQKSVYKRMEKKLDEKLKSGIREYSFDMNGVSVVSDIGSGFNKWDAFKSWGEFKEYIYLKRYDDQTIIVKRRDLSKEEYDELLTLLKKNLTEEK